jgi:L-malate glycosyltransferase
VNSINILHITPHLGGGVGTVVLNWLKKEYEINTGINHKVACLEENKNSMKEYLDVGLSISDGMYSNKNLLMEWIAQSDIVLIHWWNHPTLFEIMVNLEFPACRLIIWNHVSALYPPYIHSNKLLDFSDLFVFTSPVSYEAKEINNLPEPLKHKLDVVWSSCGTDIFRNFKNIEHDGFNIGMTGTVDYGKLHPDFIKMCSNINIPSARFIVCSGDSQERIKQDAIKYNMAEKFSFNGRVASVMPLLAIYDVFGYPLQPKHLGTCEQAIGEAMMAGVVPVVLDNAAERYIIDNGTTGIIAKSQEEYCRAIEFLYHNPDKRHEIAEKAIASAKEKYSITKKIKKWEKIFSEVLHNGKRIRRWDKEKFDSGAKVFIESLGNYGEIFERFIQATKQNNETERLDTESRIIELFTSNSQWYSVNKGGVKQYLRLYPEDYYLKLWNELLDRNPYQQ